MSTFKILAGAVTLGLLAATGASAQDFSGAYAGMGLTYSDGKTDAHFGIAPTYEWGDDSHDLDGMGIAGLVGYNWQNGSTVYGVEGGLGYANAEGDDGFYSGYKNGTKIGTTAYLAGRVGVVSGMGLFYGSLGVSAARTELTEVQVPDGPVTDRNKVTYTGPRLAIGVDYSIGAGMLRAEVAHVSYNEKNTSYDGYDIQSKLKLTTLTVGYLMKF
ncbi:outer membrane protein [Sedimentimonas flavescens]|uniref:outer membrane protein n=1 Tax=Sedimentimonas flavescens TaxID=2851012 RepID=UPI001C4A5378|nr:outer membrane beta-barrel protein [Sedimentimonas flavescens]MBW0158780.1 outer membrane beta-barrel protein [Sedimentimonas flavescens]